MRADDGNERLRSALQRFRRRLRLRRFVESLPVTAAIAIAIAAAVTVIRPEGLSLRAFTGSLALATLVAYLVALIRTPSPAATAEVIDRELRLQDRAVSALQFSGSMDAISRLVVADGASRLEELPASRLPLTVPAIARWLAIGAVALFAAVLVSRMSPQSTSAVAGGNGPATATVAGTARGQRGGVSTPGVPGSNASVPASSSPATAPIAPRQSSESGTPSGSEAGRRGEAAAAKPSSGEAIEPRAAPSTPEASRSSLAQAAGAAAIAGRDSGGGSKGGSSSSSASGRGAVTAGGREDQAGGAIGGAIARKSPPAPVQGNDAGDRRSPAYAAAYDRAEAATAAERVPFALRSYVRAYFLAIRPGSPR